MSVRIRIIDPRRTFVAEVSSSNTDSKLARIWVAIHPRQRDWGTVFCDALNLLMETANIDQHGVDFAKGAGHIVWRRIAFWTIIRVNMSVFSKKKRRLIADALLKSARYTD